MQDSQKEALREYAEQKAVIKEAEERMKVLGEMIKEFAVVDTKYDLGDAVVAYMPGKASWVYSEGLQHEIEKIENSKKEEQQLGMATQKVGSPFLQVNFKRAKKE